MKKRWIGLVAFGCALCCALPFLPLAALGLGGLVAISMDAWICGAMLLAVAIGGALLLRKRYKSTECVTTGASNCSTGCGCNPAAKISS